MAFETDKTVVAQLAQSPAGMALHLEPEFLDGTPYVHKAINTTFRSGYASTRPAFVALSKHFPKGYFQGAGVWSLTDHEIVVACIDGNIIAVDISTGQRYGFATEFKGQVLYTQVADYLVAQDGEYGPCVLEFVNKEVILLKNEKIPDPDGAVVRGEIEGQMVAGMARGTIVVPEFSALVISGLVSSIGKTETTNVFELPKGDPADKIEVQGMLLQIQSTRSYMRNGLRIGALTAKVSGTIKGTAAISTFVRNKYVEPLPGEPVDPNEDTRDTFTANADLDCIGTITVEYVREAVEAYAQYVPVIPNIPSLTVRMTGTGFLQGFVGPDEPLMIDSISIPKGKAGVYAHGRFHLTPTQIPNTSEDGRTALVSGDIRLLDEQETVLRFTETEYLAEGGANGTPEELGEIIALAVQRNSLNGTGLGSVYALCRDGACSFDFQLPRAAWKTQAISAVLFRGGGASAPRGSVNANNQIAYRSNDGIRLLAYSISEMSGGNGSLSSTTDSNPVDKWLARDSKAQMFESSMSFANNALSCSLGYGTTENGMVVCNYARNSPDVMQGAGRTWDGLWTGPTTKQVLSVRIDGRPVLCVFGHDNTLYQLDQHSVLDDSQHRIISRVETPAYLFGAGGRKKRLEYVELSLADVPITTTVKIFVRKLGYPFWHLVQERTVNVGDGAAQTFQNLRFAVQDNEHGCNPVDSSHLDVGESLQFAVEWEGRAIIKRMLAVATLMEHVAPGTCDDEEKSLNNTDEKSGVILNDFRYNFERGNK